MSRWLSHWAFSAGPYFHSISILYLLLALCLSRRPLKQFTVGAITTSSGRLIHSFTTLLLKNFVVTEFCYFSLPISNYGLESPNWMIHAMEVGPSTYTYLMTQLRSTRLSFERGVASPTWSSAEQVARPCSYETILSVRLETSVDVLSTVDMVVQRLDGPRRLRDDDNDDKVQFVPVEKGVAC